MPAMRPSLKDHPMSSCLRRAGLQVSCHGSAARQPACIKNKGSRKQERSSTMAEREEKKGTQNKGEAIQTRRQEGGTLERTGAFPGLWNENPFTFMRRMTEEMDRVFGSLVPGSRFGGGRSTRQMMWSPSIEAFQKDDKFIVRAELPGLKKDDVEVSITEDSIVLQGQRQHEHEEQR